ncbi:MAG TPA: pitrilysin family protein [Actinomycetota bacterium]|nr:pitrilysin family protein [Actinomycetota bacterium]
MSPGRNRPEGAADAAPAATTTRASEETARRAAESGLSRTEYASGLRVISEEMPEMRSVALGVWVDVGSRDEPTDIAGASHFLEHLLFKGTESRSAREIAEAFDAVGGDLNAFTAKEYTCYYCRVRDQDLSMAVEFMSDMLQNSVLRDTDFEAERMVIVEEINRQDDAPDDLIHDLFAATVWEGHPLGRPVLGTRETITGVSRDQIKDFYDRLYKPPHFVIAAAGNLHHDELCGFLEQNMDTGEKLSTTLTPKIRTAGDAPAVSGENLIRHRSTEQAHILFGTSAPSRRDPDRFAFGVVNSTLGGGMSSRLFQEVREKRGLVYSIYSHHSMFAETGLWGVYAGTTPAKAAEVLSIIRGQVQDIVDGGLKGDELERAKGHLKGSFVLSLEDTGGRMSRIGRSEISQGEILSVDEVIERTDAVTADDALRVAKEYFTRPMSLAVIGPFEEDAFAELSGDLAPSEDGASGTPTSSGTPA